MLILARIIKAFESKPQYQLELFDGLLINILVPSGDVFKNFDIVRTKGRVREKIRVALMFQFFVEAFLKQGTDFYKDQSFDTILIKFVLILESLSLLYYDFPYLWTPNLNKEKECECDYIPRMFDKSCAKEIEMLEFMRGGPFSGVLYILFRCLNMSKDNPIKFRHYFSILEFVLFKKNRSIFSNVC